MISGTRYRRRRALFWSTIASAILHIVALTLIFYAARYFITRGVREVVSHTTTITIENRIVSTPAPTPAPTPAARHARAVRQVQPLPAPAPRHEIAKESVAASPQPESHHSPAPSRVQRDQAGFAKEVAVLNKQNDPHAIPTIDPGSRGASSKSYGFSPPSNSGDPQGNGIITPVQSWHDAGRDCYYGRYEYTYGNGVTEDGSIPWAFCYDPDSDPFKEPPHPILFPLPLPGYRLPAGTELTPIERSVYAQWAGSASAP